MNDRQWAIIVDDEMKEHPIRLPEEEEEHVGQAQNRWRRMMEIIFFIPAILCRRATMDEHISRKRARMVSTQELRQYLCLYPHIDPHMMNLLVCGCIGIDEKGLRRLLKTLDRERDDQQELLLRRIDNF